VPTLADEILYPLDNPDFPLDDPGNDTAVNKEILPREVRTTAELVAISAIYYYRSKIAPQSIPRCPFRISCSRFAESAIKTRGIVRGMALFIDRHFFREHPGAIHHYEWSEIATENGIVFKLDDSSFLK